METYEEKRGDVILGAHLVQCHYDTRFDKRSGNLRCVPSPLIGGCGDSVAWTKHETMPDGWKRDVPMVLDVSATDPTRATSRFLVLSAKREGVVTGSYMGDGFGGGLTVTVKRLDGKGERIRYNRSQSDSMGVGPAVLVSREP